MMRNPTRTLRAQVVATATLMVMAVATSTHADDLKRRGLMGVQLAPITESAVAELKLENTKGMVVRGVVPDMPAQRAGIAANDVIVSVDGKSFDDLQEGLLLLRADRANDVVKLGLRRDEKPVDVELTLQERPKETATDFDIVYDSAGAPGHRVRTYVTKPKTAGKHPAILFIQSLNPGPMEFANERSARHPYKQLMDSLTRAGFVTMRVDRPGNGDSEGGDPREPKLSEDLAAFDAALQQLAGYDYVNAQRVYLFAQSSGSALAPTLARNSAARGVITYAAIARPWSKHLLDSMRRRWKLELLPDDEYDRNTLHAAKFIQQCLMGRKSPKEVFDAHPGLRDFAEPLVRDDTYIMGSHYSFYQELASLDLSRQWSEVNVPVLSLWGVCDYIAGRECSELIAESVNRKHPGLATFVVIDGVDHGFSPMEDAEESFLAGFTGEFSPAVVEAIQRWVAANASPQTS